MITFIIGFLVFYAINMALTLAFRYCDLHHWIDEKIEDCKEFWRKR
jgi:hypothetical protein